MTPTCINHAKYTSIIIFPILSPKCLRAHMCQNACIFVGFCWFDFILNFNVFSRLGAIRFGSIGESLFCKTSLIWNLGNFSKAHQLGLLIPPGQLVSLGNLGWIVGGAHLPVILKFMHPQFLIKKKTSCHMNHWDSNCEAYMFLYQKIGIWSGNIHFP
jgi:hypothetical protein